MSEIKFYIDSLYTRFEADDKDIVAQIKSLCSAYKPGHKYSKAFKTGMWDGKEYLIKKNVYIPTGLVGYVSRELKLFDDSIRIKYVWKLGIKPNLKLTIEEDLISGITLRDYQIACAEKLIAAGRGVAELATNAGKTAIFAAMIKKMNVNSLVIVRSIDLLYQIADNLSEYVGTSVGIIGDGEQNIGDFVTVATIQTLHKRKKHLATFLKKVELLVVDECHHLSSDTYMEVLFSIPCKHRYGFSGTPMSRTVLNDLKLIAHTGDIIYKVTNANLIEWGYSSQPIIHMHKVGARVKESWGLNYQTAYDKYIVNNKQRNRLIANICTELNGVTLVVVTRVEHCHILASMIQNSVFATGNDDANTRKSLLHRMQNEEGNLVVIATNIFDEGVDVSNISNIVLAAGGKSRINLLQRIGRGLRLNSAAGNVIHVHDFIDAANRHLQNHTDSRTSVYIEQGFKVHYHDSPEDLSSIGDILHKRGYKTNRKIRIDPSKTVAKVRKIPTTITKRKNTT